MCCIDSGANDSRFITNFSSHAVLEVILILTVLAGARGFFKATSGTEQPILIKLRKKQYQSPEFIIMLNINIIKEYKVNTIFGERHFALFWKFNTETNEYCIV